MRRIAEIPSPWRYVVIALLVIAAILLLQWLEEDEGTHAPACGRGATHAKMHGADAAGGSIEIHYKLRPGASHHAHAVPLFTHLPASVAAVDDPRARWRRIDVPARRASEVMGWLAQDPEVEEAFVAPEITLPYAGPEPRAVGRDSQRARRDGDSCPINTPSYEHHQGYVGPAPEGIDAPAAWRRGVRGQGVWFADVEGGWNAKHEDLPGDRIVHASGRVITDPMWRMHGTAVLGEVVGRDNGKGVVGLAPDVERVFTSSIGGQSVADALDGAAERLRAGDVLLIELQGTGPRGRFLPVEWWDDNYDAIRAATQRGVVVIEAAGNGGEDLDRSTYKGKLSRSGRDSGAIMVGAGGPARAGYRDRARLDFSNFGTRVDVQGWGRKVATLDYGDLQSCKHPDDRAYADRHYTNEFSGTSSASPIVAGAAVLLESWSRRERGAPLAPEVVRDVLRRTGTPQTDGIGGSFVSAQQNIGPRPDLSRALDVLERAPR
ncbi:MAG TPA: S8 family serine peptidase [Kofleriaceae bacterium]|nr:S8 family serine peptidase [Kofleriaceae bacterium]